MGDKLTFNYTKNVFKLALPVMVQQFITAFASLIDNLMVGVNGKDAINAVGASGNIFFVIMLLGYGISNGVGIFLAQQYGSKQYKGMHYVFLIGIIGAIIIGLTSSVFVFGFKEFLINLFTRVETQHDLAYQYLSIAVFTYPIILVSISIAGAYRRCGNTVLPMISGVISIIINTCLNYLLINGNLGFPSLGVSGAALATLIARSIELIILIIMMEKRHMPFRPNFKDIFKIPISSIKKVLSASIPLTLNEFLWGLGQTTLMALYGIKHADNYTAVQMSYTTANLLFVVMSGFATSVSILIGQDLGKNDFVGAKNHSILLVKLSILTGIGVLILTLLLSFITPNFYNVSADIRQNSANILRIMAFYFPIFILTATLFFTLRAGGDVIGVLAVDGCFMWCICIPIAFVVNNYLPLSIVISFLLVQSSDILKLLVIRFRYSKGYWIKKIV
ncbi:MAG: MATE family efflux transporter [Bacilli bacterium]